MMRKIFFVIFTVLIVAIGSFFIYSSTFFKNIRGNADPAEKIVIANIGEYSIFNLIAEKNGYFRENNLEAKIIEYPSGPSAVADLLAGKVDFAVAADFVGVRNIFANDNIRIVAEVSKHEDFRFVARKDAGISSPSHLKGKKIGVTKKGVGEFFLGRFLAFNDLYLSDVQIIDLPPAEIVGQLKSGRIDAAVVFNPYVYALQRALGDSVIVWPVQDGQKVFALLYSTDSFIGNHLDTVRRYMQALIKAERFLKENNAQARSILADAMGYEAAYIDYIWQKFDFTIGLEQALLLSMEDQARFVIENKLTDIAKIPNYLNYTYLGAIQEVAPERISIIH